MLDESRCKGCVVALSLAMARTDDCQPEEVLVVYGNCACCMAGEQLRVRDDGDGPGQ